MIPPTPDSDGLMTKEQFDALDGPGQRLNKLSRSGLLEIIDRARRLLVHGGTVEEARASAEELIAVSIFASFHWDGRQANYYRARVHKPGEQFRQISEVLAPPSCPLNRANLDGRRVLYLASTLDTAVFEVDARPGDTVTVAKLSASRPIKLLDMGCAERCIGANAQAFRDAIKTRAEDSFNFGLDRNGSINLHILQDFLVSLFASFVSPSNRNQYLLSAQCAERLLWSPTQGAASGPDPLVDGLMYPSVSNLWNSHCVVVGEQTFGQLRVEELFEVLVLENQQAYPFSFLGMNRQAGPATDAIAWGPDASERGTLPAQLFGPEMPRASDTYVQLTRDAEGNLILKRSGSKGGPLKPIACAQ